MNAVLRQPIEIVPPSYRELLYRHADYKIIKGGRGSAKSMSVARIIVTLSTMMKTRILCARETMSSIKDSVHQELVDAINELGLRQLFIIHERTITSHTGSEFIFRGLRHNMLEIKSLKGIGLCWVEEAQSVTNESWEILEPTLFRVDGCECFITFNPMHDDDATLVRFVKNADPSWIVLERNWRDNPYFPAGLERQRQRALRLIDAATSDDERAQAQADYDHVWEGKTKKLSMATVIKRMVVTDFDEPPIIDRIHYGIDWGYSSDPFAMIRYYITRNQDGSEEMWITHEHYEHGLQLDQMPERIDRLFPPDVRQWPIKADNSQPMCIDYLAGKGFFCTAAEKWPGSVEDGIAHLNSFRRINVHPRCAHIIDEGRKYSFKVDDRLSPPAVLPVLAKGNDHGWDAVRYGMDGYIQHRGATGVWEQLGQ